jgi:hypothetical protein
MRLIQREVQAGQASFGRRVHLHRGWRTLACLWLVSPLFSCDSNLSAPPGAEAMRLHALSPYVHEFANETGKYRIDYYYIDAADPANVEFREQLRVLVEEAHARLPRTDGVSSIYVYRRTETLNRNFAGNAEALSGVYDKDLVSYSRWNEQDIDIFYLVEDGLVVFDLLSDRAVSEPWEFD